MCLVHKEVVNRPLGRELYSSPLGLPPRGEVLAHIDAVRNSEARAKRPDGCKHEVSLQGDSFILHALRQVLRREQGLEHSRARLHHVVIHAVEVVEHVAEFLLDCKDGVGNICLEEVEE